MDNTWILYSADHGDNLGDHRLSEKMVFYESALNIPWPHSASRWNERLAVQGAYRPH